MIAVPEFNKAISYCEGWRFCQSRNFETILASEEEHVDCLETQLGLIEKMGIENYLQAKMG